mmetsp:Transcript_6321/g.12595  ORF Transcript_6321/g.12595 Transcript_6321/m.12595 type:complete len:186 (-) Transcript_6321:1612-2169(-)
MFSIVENHCSIDQRRIQTSPRPVMELAKVAKCEACRVVLNGGNVEWYSLLLFFPSFLFLSVYEYLRRWIVDVYFTSREWVPRFVDCRSESTGISRDSFVIACGVSRELETVRPFSMAVQFDFRGSMTSRRRSMRIGETNEVAPIIAHMAREFRGPVSGQNLVRSQPDMPPTISLTVNKGAEERDV